MQARLRKMEAEMASLRNMQAAVNDEPVKENGSEGKPTTPNPEGDGMQTDEAAEAVDSRSVYVGNVSTLLACLPSAYQSLGRLRGLSRGNTGAFLCLWDDKSSHHIMRQIHRPSQGVLLSHHPQKSLADL